MKTSFYFVLWILIYPILGLLNNEFVNNNSFLVALVAVWGLSWLLNRVMPKTLIYERVSQIAPILEDVYTGNVSSFSKRLSSDTLIETVTAIYFSVTTLVVALTIFLVGVNDWVALIVFGFFTIGAISRSIKLGKAKARLHSNPTAEECMEIATDVYQLDYRSYYEAHNGIEYSDMLPPKPRYFKGFQIFSLVMAGIAAILGLLYIISGILLMFNGRSIEIGALAGMYFLYGSLATYFGLKDIITITQSFKKKSAPITIEDSTVISM